MEVLSRKRKRQVELRRLDPEVHKKHLAHLRVADALRSGRLVRPDFCSRCGAVGSVQGHHADYDRPMDVEWVCLDCHIEEHRARP
jgi:ribosomal protein S27AE